MTHRYTQPPQTHTQTHDRCVQGLAGDGAGSVGEGLHLEDAPLVIGPHLQSDECCICARHVIACVLSLHVPKVVLSSTTGQSIDNRWSLAARDFLGDVSHSGDSHLEGHGVVDAVALRDA